MDGHGVNGHEIKLDKDGRCVNCHRPVPKVQPDAPTGPKRERLALTVPPGEEGVLEEMLIGLVDRYKEHWPDELGPVGADFWRYKAVCFAAYMVLTHNLVPAEEGA
jgi:hypothetical protein